MEILGVGPLEIILILLLALIILGPTEMGKFGRTLGRFLRKLTTSPTYQEVRNLPYRLMREAGIEDLQKELDLKKELDLRDPGRGTAGDKENKIAPEWISQARPDSNAPAGEAYPAAGAPAEWTTPPRSPGSGAPGAAPEAPAAPQAGEGN
jgi:Sec-independent protein translocase protein TatA